MCRLRAPARPFALDLVGTTRNLAGLRIGPMTRNDLNHKKSETVSATS